MMPKNCDIENLGDSACIEKLTKNFKSHMLREPCHDHNENGSTLLPPVSSLCKANEVCEKYSECLSKPSCVEEKWLHKTPASSPGKNKPFSKAKSSSQIDNKRMLFSPFFEKSDVSVWLKKNKEDKENVPAESPFLKAKDIGSPSKSLNDWLIQSVEKPAMTFKIPQNDINFWLMKPSSKETYKIN